MASRLAEAKMLLTWKLHTTSNIKSPKGHVVWTGPVWKFTDEATGRTGIAPVSLKDNRRDNVQAFRRAQREALRLLTESQEDVVFIMPTAAGPHGVSG